MIDLVVADYGLRISIHGLWAEKINFKDFDLRIMYKQCIMGYYYHLIFFFPRYSPNDQNFFLKIGHLYLQFYMII